MFLTIAFIFLLLLHFFHDLRVRIENDCIWCEEDAAGHNAPPGRDVAYPQPDELVLHHLCVGRGGARGGGGPGRRARWYPKHLAREHQPPQPQSVSLRQFARRHVVHRRDGGERLPISHHMIAGELPVTSNYDR